MPLLALWLAGCGGATTPPTAPTTPPTSTPDCDHPDLAGDGLDQDCDGLDGDDEDADGVASVASGGADCDDADPRIGPTATDIVGDAIDQNCDGVDGTDVDRDGVPSLASGGADCDDLDAAVRPDAPEVFGNRLDDDCDGGVDRVALEDEPERALGTTAGGALGYAVAAGDLDGDGVLEALAAEPGAGRVQVLGGGRWTGEALGVTLDVLDDLDGDGLPEWAASAPEGYFGGVAFLGDGLPAGDVPIADAARTTFETAIDLFLGFAVAEATGDGVADLLVFDEYFDGTVFVLAGPVPAGVLAPEAASTAELRTDRPGAVEAFAAGDVDGDGVGDVITGEWEFQAPWAQVGRVCLAYGPLSGELLAGDGRCVDGDVGYTGLGRVVDLADVDGDGALDIVSGSWGHGYLVERGRVWVLDGELGGTIGDATATIDGDLAYDRIGAEVAPAGDLDGDGAEDLLVGSAALATSWAVLGPLAGASTIAAVATATFVDAPGSLHGGPGTLAAPGDLDGDGGADLLLGAPGVLGVAPGGGAVTLVPGHW